MARNRMIKLEFFSDKKLSMVSIEARYTFIGMWPFADDYGVVKANKKWLLANIFEEDNNTGADQLSSWLEELEGIGVIIRYTSDDKDYYFIKNWSKHQKVDKPSSRRNPEPPPEILSNDSRECRE